MPVDALTASAADKVLDHVIAVEKAMTGVKLLIAKRAAEGETWRTRGARSAADDLAKRMGTSAGQAKDVLQASEQLGDQPEVEDALRDGKLSEKQATAIADAADKDPGAQQRLLEAAAKDDYAALRDTCGRVKAAADPDAEATHRRIHRERCHRQWTGSDGSINGSYKMTPREGAELGGIIQGFLSPLARAARTAGSHDTLENLAADALLAMARAAAGTPTGTGTGTGATTKTQAFVIIDRDALLRGHTEGEEVCEISTAFGPVSVPVSVAQEILDDAFLTGVFMDGVDVTAVLRFGRHIPAAVRDALRIRDDFTCAVSGCSRRARLEIDHAEPVHRGGPTRYTNLRHLCWHHHQQKTARDRHAESGPAP
jgi:hypothetical protein